MILNYVDFKSLGTYLPFKIVYGNGDFDFVPYPHFLGI